MSLPSPDCGASSDSQVLWGQHAYASAQSTKHQCSAREYTPSGCAVLQYISGRGRGPAFDEVAEVESLEEEATGIQPPPSEHLTVSTTFRSLPSNAPSAPFETSWVTLSLRALRLNARCVHGYGKQSQTFAHLTPVVPLCRRVQAFELLDHPKERQTVRAPPGR